MLTIEAATHASRAPHYIFASQCNWRDGVLPAPGVPRPSELRMPLLDVVASLNQQRFPAQLLLSRARSLPPQLLRHGLSSVSEGTWTGATDGVGDAQGGCCWGWARVAAGWKT
jgi:hypothetical protein